MTHIANTPTSTLVMPSTGPAWLNTLRQKGYDNFSRLGFPTARKGNEAWKYTNVAPIARSEFSLPSKASALEAEEVRKVAPWVNDWNTLWSSSTACSDSDLSNTHEPDGVTVSSLGDALRGDGAVVQQNIGSLTSVEDDGFAALNTAFITDGALVHVPPGTRVERPVHLVFVSSTTKRASSPTLGCW